MIKVRELKGIKSLWALNGFNALMLGLKQLPAYSDESYEEFFAKIQAMDEPAQETLVREAALFVQLQTQEVEAMISFCEDANGVAYGPENLKNLSAAELLEIIVAVSMQIAKIDTGLVSDAEKKKYQTSRST